MVSYAIAVVEDICDNCVATKGLFTSPISINTLTGETECDSCSVRGQLSEDELVDILMNLED